MKILVVKIMILANHKLKKVLNKTNLMATKMKRKLIY